MDQYAVVAPDGKEYGPVDLPGLLEWAREGRLLKTTPIAARVGPQPGTPAAAFCVGLFVAQPVIFTAIALAYRFLQTRHAARTTA